MRATSECVIHHRSNFTVSYCSTLPAALPPVATWWEARRARGSGFDLRVCVWCLNPGARRQDHIVTTCWGYLPSTVATWSYAAERRGTANYLRYPGGTVTRQSYWVSTVFYCGNHSFDSTRAHSLTAIVRSRVSGFVLRVGLFDHHGASSRPDKGCDEPGARSA